jgi:hypothetical protein
MNCHHRKKINKKERNRENARNDAYSLESIKKNTVILHTSEGESSKTMQESTKKREEG